jgi:hypothetical protein
MLPTATAKYDIPSAGLQRVSHDRIWYPACFGMACRLIVDDIEPWCEPIRTRIHSLPRD